MHDSIVRSGPQRINKCRAVAHGTKANSGQWTIAGKNLSANSKSNPKWLYRMALGFILVYSWKYQTSKISCSCPFKGTLATDSIFVFPIGHLPLGPILVPMYFRRRRKCIKKFNIYTCCWSPNSNSELSMTTQTQTRREILWHRGVKLRGIMTTFKI